MSQFDSHATATAPVRWLAPLLLLALPACAKVADSPPDAAKSTAGAPVATRQNRRETGRPAIGVDASCAGESTADAPRTTATTRSEKAAGAVVRGVVKLDGPPPERLPIDMTQVPECLKVHGSATILNEDTIVGPDGEVKNAFVYIRGAPKQPDRASPPEPAVLDQVKCMYRPRVQGIRVGQTLEIRNSDDFAHNIRGYPLLNPIFNIGQPAKGDVRQKVFDLVEVPPIKVKCDIHPWMTAYVFVVDHTYFAVTGDDGSFEIVDLPPGDYTLAVWHETFGKDQREITVDDQGASGADFTLRIRP